MRPMWLKVLTCILALAMLGGPAAAKDFTGSEEEERTLNCPAAGQSVPKNQEEPGPGECQGTAKTYKGYVYTNDVKCGSGGTDAQAAKIYTTNSGTSSGGVGICNDGGSVPVQGRVVLQGSTASGLSAYADGDKDNTQHEKATGWARLDAGTGGPQVRCGDNAGRRDVTNATADDTQADCQS